MFFFVRTVELNDTAILNKLFGIMLGTIQMKGQVNMLMCRFKLRRIEAKIIN